MNAPILIADDSDQMREFYRTMLSQFAFDVADDGAELVRMAGEKPYRLILTDLTMPKITGCEAVRMIREGEGPNRNTCICSITGDPALKADRETIASGFDHHYDKPIDLDVLTRLFMWASEPDLPRFVLPVD